MKYVPVAETDDSLFHRLMNDYYREGEDASTPQDEIDGFVQFLHELCVDGKISGCVAWDAEPVGFVLWNIDTVDGVFSNKPGMGTILEIGVSADSRGKGYGRLLADFALAQMAVSEYYVYAYGPAENFWKKCGFRDSGEIAENGLKIYVRDGKTI